MPETRKCGGWIFQISLDSMPEKVATAFGELNKLKGVRYKPVAYLGSQVVNGTNYAILAEQVIFDAENTKNLVLIVFNVAPNAPEATVVYIKPVLDGFSQEFGGIVFLDDFKITEDAQKDFDSVQKEFVGSNVEPFALVAKQIAKGVNYYFVAIVTPLYPGAEPSVDLVIINAMCYTIEFKKIL